MYTWFYTKSGVPCKGSRFIASSQKKCGVIFTKYIMPVFSILPYTQKIFNNKNSEILKTGADEIKQYHKNHIAITLRNGFYGFSKFFYTRIIQRSNIQTIL